MDVIQQTTDIQTPIVIDTVVSDIHGGVSLDVSDMVVGNIVPEGNPLSIAVAGLRKPCKQAILLAGSTTTVLKIESQYNPFKAGDVIGNAVGGKAYTVQTVTVANDIATVTLNTPIDSAVAGSIVVEMAAEVATDAVLANTPACIVRNAFVVPNQATKVLIAADGVLRADVKAGFIGADYLSNLKGVIEVV